MPQHVAPARRRVDLGAALIVHPALALADTLARRPVFEAHADAIVPVVEGRLKSDLAGASSPEVGARERQALACAPHVADLHLRVEVRAVPLQAHLLSRCEAVLLLNHDVVAHVDAVQLSADGAVAQPAPLVVSLDAALEQRRAPRMTFAAPGPVSKSLLPLLLWSLRSRRRSNDRDVQCNELAFHNTSIRES